jgi:acylphosphatase
MLLNSDTREELCLNIETLAMYFKLLNIMKKTINCFVSGRVQGVCFRMSTNQQAKLLGLTGWVRNLEDGRVEVLASGETNLIEQLQQWLAHGPEMAKVINVECHVTEYQEFPDFSIR